MKNITMQQLEDKFGETFVHQMKVSFKLSSQDSESVEAWPVGKAKDHFSEMLDRIRDGEGQLVRRHSEDPVVMLSMSQLAAFIEVAAPKRRFSEMIAYDPTLPVGTPLTASEAAIGKDQVNL